MRCGPTKCPENLQLPHFTSMVCVFNSPGPKKAQGDANFKAGWARGQESDSLQHEGQGVNMFSLASVKYRSQCYVVICCAATCSALG